MSNPKLVKQLEKDTDPSQFNIDNAFLKACLNCGIDPVELKGKPLDTFQSKGTSEDVAVRRFNNHQNARVRKLYLVVNERKRLLADEEHSSGSGGGPVKSPRRQESTAKKSDTATGAPSSRKQTATERKNGGVGQSEDNQEPSQEGDQPKETSSPNEQKVREPKPPGSKRGSGRSRNGGKDGDKSASEDGDGSQRSHSTSSSQRNKNNQKDMMMDRARRQRQQWDQVNERHEKSRQAVESQRDTEVAKSKDYAENYRQKREKELEEKKMLNEMNQEQMKKRWKRDEELAEKRQQRIDGEFEHRFDQFENHQAQILRARAKRDEQLALSAREDSDRRTAIRLQRARETREAEEERKREQAEARVSAVEEQRRLHVYQQFVQLTKQNEKALKDREHTQQVLDRSEKNKNDRAHETMNRIDDVEERGTKRKDDLKGSKTADTEKKTTKREESHKTARERRRQLAEQQQKQRDELDKERTEKQSERKKRQELERTLSQEDAAAKEEYHQDVLKRVARVAEAQQDSKQKNFEQRQQNHSERMKQLSEVRSLLKQ